MIPIGKNKIEHTRNKFITNFGVNIGFHAIFEIKKKLQLKLKFSTVRKALLSSSSSYLD
jgi:hypothetical protein